MAQTIASTRTAYSNPSRNSVQDARCQQVHTAQITAATVAAYCNPSRIILRRSTRRQVSTGAHGSTHRHDRVADWNPPHKRKHFCRLCARCVCGSARWSDHTRCRLEPTTGQLCPRRSARSKVPSTPSPSTQIGSDRADSAVL